MRRVIGLVIAVALAGCANARQSHDAGNPPDGPTAQPPPGVPGRQVVPAAIKARSTNFKLVGTVTPGDSSGSSPGYTHHGGVVGATQP